MKKVFSRIFKVRYFLTVLLLGTVLILILNPNYLYDKGEYFKTEYTEIRSASSYQFFPENPYWDIVLLRESIGKIEFNYMNLSSNKINQIDRLDYSINSEIDKIISYLYYDEEDKIVYTILTNNGNNYELFELNEPDKQTFMTKSYEIYKYTIYDSLKASGSITINSTKFYPYKVFTNPVEEFNVTAYEDGFRFEFSVDMITSLIGYKYYDEIETDECHKKIAELLSQKLEKKFKALDIYKITTYFRRNSYYNKRLFSKPDYKKRGFLTAKILGKIDVSNDKKKDFLILIHGHRFLNDKLFCIDAENKEIIYEREFAPNLIKCQIVDIDGNGIEEILLSFYSPCFEFPYDWHEHKTPGVNYKAKFYILDSKFNIREINNNTAIESEPGFYHYQFLYLNEINKIILGLYSPFDNSDKKLLLYDIINDKIDTLDIIYQNLCGISQEKNNIIFWNFAKNKISKITLDKNFQIKDSIGILVEKQYREIKQKSIRINNHDHTVLDPLTIIDDKLNIIYSPEQEICTGTTTWKGDDCYFIEIKDDKKFLSKLHFERNKTINPYVIIIFLAEILLIITYLFIFQRVKIPLNTGTSSYFVLYTIFGKLYYWQLYGRLKTIYKLPKNVALSKEIPEKIFRDIAEDIKIVFEKSFVLFKYKVYEILSYDEFQIIQRISHDLKNQILLAKFTAEQFEKESTGLLNTDKSSRFFNNLNLSFKEISNTAVILSSFSRIKKLYKEKVDITLFIESIISQYVNHPLFERVELIDVMVSEVEPFPNKPFDSAPAFQSSTADRQVDNNWFVNLDKNLFRIAFKNIINNALEIITEKDKIKIEISKNRETVMIEIKNPYSNTTSGHEKFYQIGFSTKEAGSGLGIPISKTIIEKHDGTLSINCENNEFLVTVILPK